MKGWLLQVSAGVGPLEVRQFVRLLANELEVQLREQGWQVGSLCLQGPEDSPRSAELELSGGEQARLARFLGTHLLVRPSPHRDKRGRKRWFAGVSVHPLVQDSCGVVSLPDSDLEISAARAGGPGGQHVNTTDSAIRIRHKPSNITVRVASERSQHHNRRVALRRLSALLAEREASARQLGIHQRRGAHYQFERGRPVCSWCVDERTQGLQRLD